MAVSQTRSWRGRTHLNTVADASPSLTCRGSMNILRVTVMYTAATASSTSGKSGNHSCIEHPNMYHVSLVQGSICDAPRKWR